MAQSKTTTRKNKESTAQYSVNLPHTVIQSEGEAVEKNLAMLTNNSLKPRNPNVGEALPL